MFGDLFEWLFDDVLGIIQFPSAPTPPSEDDLMAMTPEETAGIELDELQERRRKAAQGGGFFQSILGGGATDSSTIL